MSGAFSSPRKKRSGDSLTLSVSLWIVDRFRPLIRAFGIDYPRLRLVLENRLRIENAVNFGGGKIGAGMVWICLGTLCSGIVPGVAAIAAHDPVLWMGLGQGLWMVIVGLLTLNHFGNVLIDNTDVGVLAPLPVDDRTVLASRLAHVLLELGLLAVCAMFFPTLLGCFAFSPPAVIAIYPLSTLLSMFLVLGSITLCYAILLRWLGPARFQRATLWTQIGGATLLILAIQIGPRLVPWDMIGHAFQSSPALKFLVPPLHYEALFRVVQGGGGGVDLALAAAAAVIPLLFAWLTFRLASRHFVAALADSGAIVRAANDRFRSGWLARLGPWICSTGGARAAYGFTLAMSRREKTFLRGTLPQAATFFAMSFGVMLTKRGHGARSFDLGYAPFALYYFTMLSVVVYELSRMSEHAQARWWFDALPVADVRELMEGSAKALVCGMILPIVAVAAVLILAVAGVSSLLDVVEATLGLFAITTLQARWFFDSLPFTHSPVRTASGDRIVKIIGSLAVAGAFAGAHAASRVHWIAQIAVIVVFVVLAWVGWNGLRELNVTSRPRRATFVRRVAHP